MKRGRFFTDHESTHRMAVVVIAEDVEKQLLPNVDPIGKWILVDGHSLQVVGVMDRPAASLPGQDDTRILVPYFTMRKMFPNATEHMLVIIARNGMLDQAQDEARAAFRAGPPRSLSGSGHVLDVDRRADDRRFRRMTSTVALVMVILSSIGLLVGVMGVMNIMLVSVTERTREIGVRQAVGARSSDIVVQFLTEAVVLTALHPWLAAGLVDLARPAPGLLQPADRRAGVGGLHGRDDVGRSWPGVRHLAGRPRCRARPRGSAPVRVSPYPSASKINRKYARA
jgi:putative ABC transport system permease protein